MSLVKRVEEILQVKEFEITNQKDLKLAVSQVRDLKSVAKKLAAAKEEKCRDLKTAYDSAAKPFIEKAKSVTSVEKMMKNAIATYLKASAEKELLLTQAMEAEPSAETIQALQAHQPPAMEGVSVSRKQVPKVVDKGLVPEEYKVVDLKRIAKEKVKLPGIEYEEVATVRVTTAEGK